MDSFRLAEKARAWMPLLPLLLLLLGTYWLSQQVQPLPQTESLLRHDVDYVIDKFSAVTLDLQGQPRHTLSAEKLWHFPDDDSIHLQMPQLSSQHPKHPPSVTSARTGMLSSKGDEVFLFDEVRVQRFSASGSEQLFSTGYLHVVPDLDWAETDQAVVMTDAHNSIRAIGMEIDSKTHKVALLSHVRAIHDPLK